MPKKATFLSAKSAFDEVLDEVPGIFETASEEAPFEVPGIFGGRVPGTFETVSGEAPIEVPGIFGGRVPGIFDGTPSAAADGGWDHLSLGGWGSPRTPGAAPSIAKETHISEHRRYEFVDAWLVDLGDVDRDRMNRGGGLESEHIG